MQFIDLKTQLQSVRPQIDAAISTVLDHGKFIHGPEVLRLERRLAEVAGVDFCASCANGTDAIVLALKAIGVGAGDAVIVPSFTFAATAEAVVIAGATPIFIDVSETTFNIGAGGIKSACQKAIELNLTPRAVIAVDLFGLPVDSQELRGVADDCGLLLLADSAQSFGASLDGKPVGSLAHVTTTSFFPAKPLGCFGDGGAVFTNDKNVYEAILSLRVHGKGSDKYDNVRVGMNSRLDTIQAAILLVKLELLATEISHRNSAALNYARLLSEVNFDGVITPSHSNRQRSAWAQYTIKVPADLRDNLTEFLSARGIPTAIYYPKPLHRQTAYQAFPVSGEILSTTDALSACVMSLPMHGYLTPEDQQAVVSGIAQFFNSLPEA